MRVKSSVLLERHFNPAGNPTEEPHVYEVLVSAEVVNDDVGPVTVEDAPEVDGPLQRRVLTFSPLRGQELTQAQEAIWDCFLVEEAEVHERQQAVVALKRYEEGAAALAVREFLATLQRRRIPPQVALKALREMVGVA